MLHATVLDVLSLFIPIRIPPVPRTLQYSQASASKVQYSVFGKVRLWWSSPSLRDKFKFGTPCPRVFGNG